ncbi:hypothetical protein ACJJTC_005113 [Scirpophaga incertulas]
MFLRRLLIHGKFRNVEPCLICRTAITQIRLYGQGLENNYSDQQKNKILEVINTADVDGLARYDITKSRIKSISQYKKSNGTFTSLSDLDMVHGFSDKFAKKLFDSILEGPVTEEKESKSSNKIKGQVLQPLLPENLRQTCKTILAVFVSVNSVCWTYIDKDSYEVLEWDYHEMEYQDGKRLQIADIMTTAWEVSEKLPFADVYVMKAEPTTLRAAGSDPNNPKLLAVNLQKSQLVAMLVALINARSINLRNLYEEEETDEVNETQSTFMHKVYFLRSSLPYRLYGTLVGNERVSTDQTVEMILQTANKIPGDKSHVHVSQSIQAKFKSRKELEKDMLGHSLLLALTFMDLCIYKNYTKYENRKCLIS